MFVTVFLSLLDGFGKTLELFFFTLVGALPLGLVIAFGSMSRFAPLRYTMKSIVWVVRGTPLMLQLLIIFYGPGLLLMPGFWTMIFGNDNGRIAAVLVAFIINYACYFSEIYRGGIEGIPQGQYEAGMVLGMTRTQIFFRVVLLQVIKRILAPMSNEVITLVKDTSLARMIAVYEIIFKGEAYLTHGLVWPLFFTGAFYLLFSGLLTLLFGYAEKKLDYYKG